MEEVREEFYNPVGAMCGICPDCGNIVFLSGGVPVCTSCGWSKFPEQ